MRHTEDSRGSGTWVMLTVVCLFLTGFTCIIPGASSTGKDLDRTYAPWWDYSWNYRKPLVLDNTQNTKTLTDYPLLINLSAQDLISAGKMRGDYGDARFTDSDGTTPLNYWMETEGNFWVKIPSIPASATKTIYLYYGNSSANPAPDGAKTFDMFDDFSGNSLDTSKWQIINDGPYSFSNGMLTISACGNVQPGKLIAIGAPSDNNYIMRASFKITGGTSTEERIGLGIKTQTSDGHGYNYVFRDFTKLNQISFLDDFVVWNMRIGNWAKNQWYVEEIYHDGSNVKARLDDGAWQSQAWSGRTGYPALNFGSYDGTSVWDWALVRQYQPPDPTVSMGTEELPFRFKSVEFAPKSPNEGDMVTINAIFNNPSNQALSLNMSFREGTSFNGSALLERRLLSLKPSKDTTIQTNWTAKGGHRVIWVAVEDSPVGFANITVNRYPVLDFIPDQNLVQDWFFRLQITARDLDGDPLAWAEDSDLFDFNRTNNTSAEIAFMPTNDDVGIHTANISVTDPRGCSARQTVRFTVVNVNDPPVLERIPDLTAVEEVPFTYKVNASDPDLKWGDKMTFADDTFLFEIDHDNGNFSFTSTNEQVGKYLVEITVTDNQGLSASRNFNVTVQNVNDPPVIAQIPPQTAIQGQLWQYMVTATDPDQRNSEGDVLTFSDDSPLFDVAPDSGLITFIPANKDVGVRECSITVTDQADASYSTQLILTVLNVNDPPELLPIPDQTAVQDQTFSMTVNATDPDLMWGLDNLTFSDDSPLFEIDPKAGTISFVPTNDQVGQYNVNIRVTDESKETAVRTFSLTVLNVNDPPYDVAVTSPANGAKFKEGEPVWLNATGKDIDKGDSLVFKWLENDQEIARGRSVQVNLTPGPHHITLVVSDGTVDVPVEFDINVMKRPHEQVTVENGWWIPLAAVVIAAAAAAGAIAVFRRKRRREPAVLSEDGRGAPAPASVPPGSLIKSGPQAPMPGELTAEQVQARDRAHRAIGAVEDEIADRLEQGAAGADFTAAMESLDIARDFLKSGDYAEALKYANEAKAAAGERHSVPCGIAQTSSQPGPDVGKLACPGCGEELNPEWTACPICGHLTR